MFKENLKTTEQFHSEAVEHLLQHSNPEALKRDLNSMFEQALSSEHYHEFPEQLPELYYSYKVMHNMLVHLIFFHKKDLKPEDFSIVI